MIGRHQGELFPPALESTGARAATLAVRGLSVGGALRDVSFEVRAGEIIGLAGVEGSGVSLLLGAVAAFGLARDTGMSTEEARVFIDAYFRAYSRVREFLEGIKMQAREQGYVETLLHRRRYIQDIAVSQPYVAAGGRTHRDQYAGAGLGPRHHETVDDPAGSISARKPAEQPDDPDGA